MNEGESPNENAVSPEASLQGKINHLYKAYYTQRLTVDEIMSLIQDAHQDKTKAFAVPPNYNNHGLLVDGIRRTVEMNTEKSPVTTEELLRRGNTVLDILKENLIPEERLKEQPDSEGIRPVFRDQDALKKIRVTDFLLDTKIAAVWTGVTSDEFDGFINQTKSGQLPGCFTSDSEMRRLYGDFNAPLSNSLRRRDDFSEISVSKPLGVDKTSAIRGMSARDYFVELMVKQSIPPVSEALQKTSEAFVE